MRAYATFLILAASLLVWTGCDQKRPTRAKQQKSAKDAKATGADFSDDSEMIASFEKELAELDKALAEGTGTVPQYSRRGDLRVFLQKFEEAVADYEKMIELDPTQETKHWRLGMAYYLSGDFEKAAKLFEEYHQVDKTDREVGLWHFLAIAGIDGIPAAQSRMLPYDQKDRDPFPQIYDLFFGRVTVEDFFRGLYDEGFSTNQEVMFYARLYAGIFEEISERREPAVKYFRMAYESSWGRKATGGPAYMWQLARILATTSPEPAEAEKKEEPKKEASASGMGMGMK